MRILLDESVPGRFGALLVGHSTVTVQRRGWASIKNGELLALAASEFDVLLAADKGMEYQQNLATLPVAILIVLARSNRIEDLAVAVPVILAALAELPPRTLRKVAVYRIRLDRAKPRVEPAVGRARTTRRRPVQKTSPGSLTGTYGRTPLIA